MLLEEEQRSAADRRVSAMLQDRAVYEPDLKELEENFAPRRARWHADARKIRRRNTDIINDAPLYAVTVMKSGMMSGHTSPSRPWFKLISPDPDLMEIDSVKRWLYQVELRMREVFARSNIYNALPTCYGDLGVFGTSALGVYPDNRDTIRGYSYLVGSYAIANSARLSVDSFSRKWKSTVGNVVGQFGIKAVSAPVAEKYRGKQFDQPVTVCHLIEPNRDVNPYKASKRNMAWRETFWEEGWPESKALAIEGHHEMPVLVSRWETAGEEAWGDSPALNAVGDAKQLQYEEKAKAQLYDKIARPAMKIDPALKNAGVSLGPNGKNYVAMSAGNPGIEAVYVPSPQAIQAVTESLATLEARVHQHMFVDIFLMLSQSDRRQMTAREVEEKHSEKLLLLGPVLERLSDELLDPLIQRTFAIMLRTGLIPEWPAELDGQPIKVEYISILAQAQKQAATRAIEAVGGYVAQFAKVAPDALDKFDFDQAIDEYSQMQGAPPTIVRSDEAAANIRRQRAQAQQAAQAAANAQAMAGAARDLGNTPMGQGSALDALVRN